MLTQGFSYAYAGPVLLKDIDGRKGIVQFYGGAFGNIDSDNDVTEPGAFTKTFAENGPSGANRIKHLRQHETRTIIGKITELGQDQTGAIVTSQLVTDNSDGKDALALYEADLFEHSYGYRVMKAYKDADGVQHLTELAIREFSAVTWGANPDTPLIGIKCDNKAGLDLTFARISDRETKLTKALRHGNISDTLGHQLADELEALQIAYKGLISLSSTTLKPADEATSEAEKPSGKKALNPFLQLI